MRSFRMLDAVLLGLCAASLALHLGNGSICRAPRGNPRIPSTVQVPPRWHI